MLPMRITGSSCEELQQLNTVGMSATEMKLAALAEGQDMCLFVIGRVR